MLSKRVLLRLVNEGHVRGWDDPRMPTMSGLRRRGFPAEGIRDFATMVGVAKADSIVEVEMLEHAVRDVLNRTAPRRFAVLDPLKVVIENYPEGQIEEMEVPNNPEDPSAGHAAGCPSPASSGSSATTSWRSRCASSSAWRPAARCGCARPTSSPATRSSRTPRAGSSSCAAPTTRRRAAATLPTAAAPRPPSTGCRPRTPCPPRSGSTTTSSRSPYPGADGRDLFEDLNPDSETVLRGCFVEPSLADVPVGETVQFERLGYFCPDPDSAPGALVFNRTLTLKDTWAKLQTQGRQDTA